MEQTILALIRPKLNLSQDFGQIAHLIEHILISPKRQQTIGITDSFFANNIIYCNGFLTELYCAEYYIVYTEKLDFVRDVLLTNQNRLAIEEFNPKEFQSLKQVLIEELNEDRFDNITIAEQWQKAVYQKNSPSIRQPWNDVSKIKRVNPMDVKAIFDHYSKPVYLFILSKNQYDIPLGISLDKNKIKQSVRNIHLIHPDQALDVIDVDILIPFQLNQTNLEVFLVYQKSLIDYRFGIITEKLRYEEGTIYDINLIYRRNADAMHISFSCPKVKAKANLEQIEATFAQYPKLIRRILPWISNQVVNEYQLDWGDVGDHIQFYLEEVLFSGAKEPPQKMIERVKKIKYDKLINFHKQVFHHYRNNSLTTLLKYGKR